MKKIAIIGASYLQLPLIEKAKEMGLQTHVFAWAANDVGEKAADFFYPISIVEKEQIAQVCRDIGIQAVCSIASDLASVTVNYVAHELGLVGNSLASAQKSSNKFAMRQAFAARKDPSPRYAVVNDSTDLSLLELQYPVIVKPVDRSGSRGIHKLNSAEGLQNAVKVALEESFEKRAMVEEYAAGTEYSVEYISYRGKHYFLALTLKYTTGAPHFIETGHLEPAPVDSQTVSRVREIIEHALNTLEIGNGASHSEIKIDADGTIRIIEIGGRMGGDLIGSDLVFHSTGVDYVRAVIQIALGEEPNLTPLQKGRPCAVRFILNEQDRAAFEKMKKDRPQSIIRAEIEEIQEREVRSSAERFGFFLYYTEPA